MSKKTVFKLLMNVTGRIFMTLIACTLLFMGGFAATQSVSEDELVLKWGLVIVMIAFGFVLLPYYSFITNRLSKNASDKRLSIIRYVVTTINVLRVQVFLMLIVIACLTYEEWRKAIDYVFPIPVSENQMKAWEQQIEAGNGYSVENEVRAVTNYKKRVNTVRLAAKDLRAVFSEAEKYSQRNEVDNARNALSGSFSRFGLMNMILETKTGKFERTLLRKYFTSEEIVNMLVYYTQLKIKSGANTSGGSFDNVDSLVEIIRRIAPDNPELLLLQADWLWQNNKFCEARQIYLQYADSLKSRKKSSSFPLRVKEIISIPQEWNAQSIVIFFKIWFSEVSSYFFSGYSVGGPEPVEIGKRSFGRWCINTGSLPYLLDQEFETLAWLFASGCKSNDEQRSAWEKISKFSVRQMKPVTDQFSCFNSGFIDWLVNNAIPDPSDTIAAVPFQKMYDRIFKDWVRTFAFCYQYLSSEVGIAAEVDAYKTDYSTGADSDEKFYGPSWLKKRYGTVSMSTSEMGHDQIIVIMGFWLRRSIDGSAESIWRGASHILSKYDQEFLSKLKANEMEFYKEFQRPVEENGGEFEGDNYEVEY